MTHQPPIVIYSISIDYISGDVETYKGIDIHKRINGSLEGYQHFYRTNIVDDWKEVMFEILHKGDADAILTSKSCDKFIKDGHGVYKWRKDKSYGNLIVRS